MLSLYYVDSRGAEYSISLWINQDPVSFKQDALAMEVEYDHAARCRCPLTLHADGDELEYIRHRFDNIPMVKGRIMRWTGDWIGLILANWGGDYKKPGL